MTRSTWLPCLMPTCPCGTFADPRHVANLTAGGGWLCADHDHADLGEEVPC